MRVSYIQEFLTKLEDFDQSSKQLDEELIYTLHAHFDCLPPDTDLKECDYQLLETIYEQRFNATLDSVNDYMFDQNSINDLWICLAHRLAEENRGKTYLQWLFPSVTNTLDPVLLERHGDCKETRAFYLGEDGKTLYRVRGLLLQLQKGKPFSSYEPLGSKNDKNHTKKPVALIELFRIRAKSNKDNFEILGESYTRFWDYLKKAVMPEWSKKTQLPEQILYKIFKLLEIYYLSNSKEQKQLGMRELLLSLFKGYSELTIEEINCFYGQVLMVADKKIYILEVLLNCLEKTFSIQDQEMNALAAWLSHQNPSYIIHSMELAHIYKEQNIGKFFTPIKLQEVLSELFKTSSILLQNEIRLLQSDLQNSETISPKIITSLRSLYQLRWTELLTMNREYTRIPEGANATWIKLAQMLSGAGYIKANYYSLLMPNLSSAYDFDPLLCEPITIYPLSHFILAEDNCSLILLKNSLAWFHESKVFWNCEASPPRPFTPIEIERIGFANPIYKPFVDFATYQDKADTPISWNSLLAVKNLIEGSFRPHGLLLGSNYTVLEISQAEQSYIKFGDYLSSLTPEERVYLDNQHIFFRGMWKSFQEVYAKALQGHCLASSALWYMQMVFDYAGRIKFPDDIEDKVDTLVEMRSNSRHKVCNNYSDMDSAVAKRRIQMICVSLMTQKFQSLPMASETVKLWDYSRSLFEEAKEMIKWINPMLDNDLYKDARYIYTNVMEGVIKPALQDTRWRTRLARSSEINIWLNSVYSQTFFNSKSNWVNADILLRLCYSLQQTNCPLNGILDDFIDDYLQTYAQNKSTLLKEIRVNIKFKETMETLAPDKKDTLNVLIDQFLQKDDAIDFYKIYSDCLFHRVAIMGATALKQPGLFGKRKFFDEALYEQIINALHFNRPCDLHTPVKIFYYLEKEMPALNELEGFNKLSAENYLAKICSSIEMCSDKSIEYQLTVK